MGPVRGSGDLLTFEVHPGYVVVVVGAGNDLGDEVGAFADAVGDAGLVFAVEAHPAAARALRVAHAARDNVRVVEAAALDYHGTAWLTDGDDPQRNRVVEKPADGTRGLVPVEARRLDEIMDANGVAELDILKLNIEGSEGEALRGLGARLALTRLVIVACHDFLGLPTKAAVCSLLAGAEFDLSGHPNPIADYQADYIYGRRGLF